MKLEASLFLGVCLMGCHAGSRPNLLDVVRSYNLVHIEASHFDRVHHNADSVRIHPDVSAFTFQADGISFSIDLEKNNNLISGSYTSREIQYDSNGSKIGERIVATAATTEHCYYHGKVRAHSEDLVAINTCSGGFHGSVMHNGETYNVEPSIRHMSKEQIDNHMESAPVGNFISHVVYKSSDYPHATGTCANAEHGHHSHVLEHEHEHQTVPVYAANSPQELNTAKVMEQLKSMKRKLLQTGYYVEVYAANDFRRYSAMGQSAQTDTLDVVNRASVIYASTSSFSVPVSLTLVDQTTFTTADPWENDILPLGPTSTCTDCAANEVDVDSLLNAWNYWRNEPGNTPAHDNGQLFSGHDFQSSVVGYAGMTAMCTAATSGGINQGQDTPDRTAAVLAHEMGHNFGFNHDSSGNTCAQSGYIMNAVMSSVPTAFSQCSATYFTGFVSLGRTCLNNEPTRQWTDTPVCGNGFVEGDEACDCGSTSSCSGTYDPCCTTRCTLSSGSECSMHDGCCDNCLIAQQGTVCRSNSSVCDMEELCNGEDSACPDDAFKGAGTLCQDDLVSDGSCYSGNCMSWDRACANAFAGVSGGPWTECLTRLQYESNECGTLYCASSTGMCSSIQYSAGLNVQVEDGVPCGNQDGQQCYQGACIESVDLNPFNSWQTSWEPCWNCSDMQLSSTWCRGQDPFTGRMTSVDLDYCSPPIPLAARICLNTTSDPPCVPINSNDYIDALAQSLYTEYDMIGKAEELRASIPRMCGPNHLVLHPPSDSANFTTLEQQANDYWPCTVGTCVPGMFFCVVFFLYWFCNCCCGCRKKGCCKEETEKEDYYTASNNFMHYIVFLGFGMILAGFAALGLFMNGEVGRAIIDPELGIVNVMYSVLDTATTTALNLDVPLDAIVNTPVNESIDALDIVSYTLQYGMDDTITALEDLSDYFRDISTINIPSRTVTSTTSGSSRTGTAAGTSTTCSMCSDSADGVDDAVALMDQVRTAMQELNGFVLMFREALLMISENVQPGGAINDLQVSASELIVTLEAAEPSLADYMDTVTGFENGRYLFTCFMFGGFFYGFVSAIFAGITQDGTHFYHHYGVFLFVLPTVWFLFGLHVPFALVFGDSCELLDSGERDPVNILYWDPQVALLFSTCLANGSLTTAFNLSGEWSLSSIELPELDPDTLFGDMTAMTDLISSVDALDLSDFGLATVEADVVSSFTACVRLYRSNTIQCTYTAFGSCPIESALDYDIQGILNCKASALISLDLVVFVNNAIDDLKRINRDLNASIYSRDDTNPGIEYLIEESNDSLHLILSNLEDLLVSIQAILGLMYCGELGEIYYTFKYSFCSRLTTAISFLALSLWMCGILTVIQFPFAVRLGNGCKKHNKVHNYGPKDEEAASTHGGHHHGHHSQHGRHVKVVKKGRYDSDDEND